MSISFKIGDRWFNPDTGITCVWNGEAWVAEVSELEEARKALRAIVNDNDWGAHPHTIAFEFFKRFPDAS